MVHELSDLCLIALTRCYLQISAIRHKGRFCGENEINLFKRKLNIADVDLCMQVHGMSQTTQE